MPCYLAIQREKTFGPQNILGKARYAPTTEVTYFYRADNWDIADQIIAVFRARFKGHEVVEKGYDDDDGDEIVVRTRFLFEVVPSHRLDQGERLVIDEQIGDRASAVSRHSGQWQYEALEMQADGIFGYDPYDPPLYDEKNPLSPESLYQQAEKWEAKLRPPPDIPPWDLKQVLSWEGADLQLSIAENWKRMKSAEAARQKKLSRLAGKGTLSPFDLALVQLLESLPATWAPTDFSKFSHAQEKAFDRLTGAGLVENRIEATATMDGRTERVSLRCRATGDFKRKLCHELFTAAPGWLTEDGRATGPTSFQYDVVEARLTQEGEQAKQDWNSPEPSFVLAIVRGVGPEDPGGIKAEGTVAVEERQVESLVGQSDAAKPHPRQRQWTRSDVDQAIRVYKAAGGRAARYADLREAVAKKRPGALKEVRKLFGRNVIARHLSCSPTLVSNSPAWLAIAEELKIPLRRHRLTGSRRTSKPGRIGHEMAVEQSSAARASKEDSPSAAMEKEEEEDTLRRIRRLADAGRKKDAEALLAKYKRGDMTDDEVRQTVEVLMQSGQ